MCSSGFIHSRTEHRKVRFSPSKLLPCFLQSSGRDDVDGYADEMHYFVSGDVAVLGRKTTVIIQKRRKRTNR